MGHLEIACLALAAIIMAVNQALKGAPALRSRLPAIPGWVNYLPLALMIIAGGAWAIRATFPTTPKTEVTSMAPSAASNSTTSAPAPPNFTDYAPQAVAVKFLSLNKSGVSPTPLQLDLLLRPYIGKRMRLSGTIDSISVEQDGSLQVQLSPQGAEGGSFFVIFPKKWTPQLSNFGTGATMNIDVLISDGEPPALTDGELF